MRPRSWLLLALLAASCGGRSRDQEAAPPRGGAGTAGGAGANGAGGAGGTSGGAGSAGGPPTCMFPAPGCLLNCATMGGFQARCVDGEWSCLEGVFYSDCPPDSCSMDRGTCCHPTTGDLSGAECGPDEKRLPCDEPGAERIPDEGACIPDSLDVTDCHDVDGQACETAGLQCNNAGGCRFSCSCISGDGGLVWFCITPVC